MDFIKNGMTGHQGDVQFFEISSIPDDAKKVKKEFFAASEKSKHAHALAGNYDMYAVEGGHIIDVKKGGAVLNHTHINNLTAAYWDKAIKTGVADHEPTTFKEGKFFVGIQNRVNPFSGLWEEVQD